MEVGGGLLKERRSVYRLETVTWKDIKVLTTLGSCR